VAGSEPPILLVWNDLEYLKATAAGRRRDCPDRSRAAVSDSPIASIETAAGL
jgi:hypothetical protein